MIRGMYQVHVTQGKNEIPIGPAVSDRRILEDLVRTINKMVKAGREKRWHDARIVPVALFH